VTRGEEFVQLRPLLFSIAYRILGSVSEEYELPADPLSGVFRPHRLNPVPVAPSGL
jgi:hypothetical protein